MAFFSELPPPFRVCAVAGLQTCMPGPSAVPRKTKQKEDEARRSGFKPTEYQCYNKFGYKISDSILTIHLKLYDITKGV